MYKLLLPLIFFVFVSSGHTAQQVLNDLDTMGNQRTKINQNFTELYGWGDHDLAGYLDQTAGDNRYSLLAHNHSGVYELSLGNPGSDGLCLVSTTTGTRSWSECGTGGGGEANVQADWNVSDVNSDAFILNKPSLDYEPLDATILRDADLDIAAGTPTIGSIVTWRDDGLGNPSLPIEGLTITEQAEDPTFGTMATGDLVLSIASGDLFYKSATGGYTLTGVYTVDTDTTPDQFTFVDQLDVDLSTEITSEPITVEGINTAADITVTGGTYDINESGTFVSTAGTVNVNDTVRARHTSSDTAETAVNTVVTIGGVEGTFTSTTAAAVVADFPTIRASNSGQSDASANQGTITLPTGHAEGDLLIIGISLDGANVDEALSGWTLLANPSDTTLFKFPIWYKVRGETESDPVITWGGATQSWTWYSIAITAGTYSGTPEYTTAAGTDASPDAPSLTPSWGAANTLWFALHGWDNNPSSTTDPTDYTLLAYEWTPGAGSAHLRTHYRAVNAASQDPSAITINAAHPWYVHTLAIAPAGL